MSRNFLAKSMHRDTEDGARMCDSPANHTYRLVCQISCAAKSQEYCPMSSVTTASDLKQHECISDVQFAGETYKFHHLQPTVKVKL